MLFIFSVLIFFYFFCFWFFLNVFFKCFLTVFIILPQILILFCCVLPFTEMNCVIYFFCFNICYFFFFFRFMCFFNVSLMFIILSQILLLIFFCVFPFTGKYVFRYYRERWEKFIFIISWNELEQNAVLSLDHCDDSIRITQYLNLFSNIDTFP